MSKVCQLFSGSSGNSILISSKGKNILVDIGVSAKKCENALLQLGVAPESIDAVFVTHEHCDHSAGVRVFASRHHTPVFASALCLDAMKYSGIINDKVEAFEIENNMEISGIEISAFHQSHDSVDCVGYKLFLPNGRKVAVCTDTGYVTDEARQMILGTDLVFLESNHEVSMVETGPYTYPLKKRILGTEGHLSNFACGEFASELVKSGTTGLVLSHLSRENNMPDIARQTVFSALSEAGMKENYDYRLWVSPPVNESGFIGL